MKSVTLALVFVLANATTPANAFVPGLCQLMLDGYSRTSPELKALVVWRQTEPVYGEHEFYDRVYEPMTRVLWQFRTRVFEGQRAFTADGSTLARFLVPIAQRAQTGKMPGMTVELLAELKGMTEKAPYVSETFGEFKDSKDFVNRVAQWLLKPEHVEFVMNDAMVQRSFGDAVVGHLRSNGSLRGLKLAPEAVDKVLLANMGTSTHAGYFQIGGVPIESNFRPVLLTNESYHARLLEHLDAGGKAGEAAASDVLRYLFKRENYPLNPQTAVILERIRNAYPNIRVLTDVYERNPPSYKTLADLPG